MEIRRLTQKDAELLCAISRKTFSDTFTGTCLEEDMQWYLNNNFNVDSFFKELSNDSIFCYAAFDDNEIAGFVKFKENIETLTYFKDYKALELKSLYIDAPYHGKGVAQILIDYLFKHANSLQYEVIYLSVWEYNFRAQAFYKKFNFEDSGYTNYFPIGNTPQTDLWYWQQLKH